MSDEPPAADEAKPTSKSLLERMGPAAATVEVQNHESPEDGYIENEDAEPSTSIVPATSTDHRPPGSYAGDAKPATEDRAAATTEAGSKPAEDDNGNKERSTPAVATPSRGNGNGNGKERNGRGGGRRRSPLPLPPLPRHDRRGMMDRRGRSPGAFSVLAL